MEYALRKEYQKLYSLDEMQAEILSHRTVENVLRCIGMMNEESAFEFFSVLCDMDLQSCYYMLESFCMEEDKDVRSLRVLLPFVYVKLIERLASTEYAEKLMTKLQSQYKTEMGSRVRMPLRFTTDAFKKYLFKGTLLQDVEEGNLLDLGIEEEMSLKTSDRVRELLALQDLQELYVNLNYFSRFHVPFDYVAAVRAVLKSQARKEGIAGVG